MRNYLMTYVPARKGWMKQYKGKTFAISCKQLGCPPGKEGSWQAANLWWESKQKEFDQLEAANAPPPPPPKTVVVEELERWLGHSIGTEGEAVSALAKFFMAAERGELTQEKTEALVGVE